MTARDMVCTCRIEGMREVERVRRKAMQTLGLDTMADLSTAVVLSLAFDFQATAWIAADMWFGVEVTPKDGEPMWIECDQPVDGLLYLWTEMADRHPGKVTRQRLISLGYERAVMNSDAHLARLQSIEGAKGAHRKEHGGEYLDTCEACRALIDKQVQARIEMDHAWGTEVMDAAVDSVIRASEAP